MPDALRAERVSVTRGARTVVDTVSFGADYGRVTAIIGPNGAGKSSLLRALAGLLPYAGSVTLGDLQVRSLPIDQRARAIAYVPQQTMLTASVRVADVVAQGRFAYGRGLGRSGELDEPSIDRALADAQITHLRDRAFSKLSGGEQRRVLLARALATEARVLLLDEPTAGLDVAQVLRFHQLVVSLAARGLCIVSVLHDLMDVYEYADRAVLLSHGKLALQGTAREVVKSAEAEQIYGVRMTGAGGARFSLLGEPS